MSGASPDAPPPKYDPLAALRQPNFLFYTVSRVFSTLGNTMLQAAMLWQVWEISGSELSLGFLGLARFFPSLGFSLVGGAVADTYNRRTIILCAQTIPFTCTAVLAVATLGGWVSLWLIYGLVLLLGLASAFEAPARAALLPAIVRPETFANAVTVSSTVQQLSAVCGPAIAGGLIAFASVGAVYSVFLCLAAVAFVTLAFLRYAQNSEARRSVSIAAIKEGLAFLRRQPVVLGSMSLDMFAVVFGGAAMALLPVYATDILDVGAGGYGLLSTATRVGAFLTAFLLVMRPPIQRAGRALIWSVVLFGIATILFGLSHNFILSLVLYMFVGAVDQVSMVMRGITIQLATPDELRGRVSAVNQIFVGTSNQVGAMEAGFAAAVTSATFAVVSGGAAAIGVAGLVGWRNKELYNYTTPGGRDKEITPAPETVASAAG